MGSWPELSISCISDFYPRDASGSLPPAVARKNARDFTKHPWGTKSHQLITTDLISSSAELKDSYLTSGPSDYEEWRRANNNFRRLQGHQGLLGISDFGQREG